MYKRIAEHSAFNLLRISTYGDKKIRLEWFGTHFVKFPKQSIKIYRLLLCLREYISSLKS